VKERPILFSGPMVRAILRDTKTQTRRVVKPQPTPESDGLLSHPKLAGHFAAHVFGPCMAKLAASPYGGVGDRLWVRETHAQFAVGNRTGDAPQCVAYRATCDEDGGFEYVNNGDEIMRLRVTKWTPGIHMPRWASRITLEIESIRVERLHDISEADAAAEGVRPFFEIFESISQDQRICDGELARDAPHRASFACLWDEVNGDHALWSSNPWVWALGFKRLERP
jgi:hypothetical protein